MRFKVFHLDWEKGDAIDRELRRDVCDGRYADDAGKLSVAISALWCGRPVPAYEQVADIWLEGSPVEDGLETCFAMTNSIETAWFTAENSAFMSLRVGSRSTSVGDIIKVVKTRQTFVCAPAGWVELP